MKLTSNFQLFIKFLNIKKIILGNIFPRIDVYTFFLFLLIYFLSMFENEKDEVREAANRTRWTIFPKPCRRFVLAEAARVSMACRRLNTKYLAKGTRGWSWTMLPRGHLLEKNDRTRRSKLGNTSRFGNKTILQGRVGSRLGLVTFRSLQLYWVFIGRR